MPIRVWLCLALSCFGCVPTAGGMSDGNGDGDADADLVGDADGDADADADADTDADTDADADTDSDTGVGCPAYPAGPYGFGTGDVVADFALPGAAIDRGIDDEISLGDIWCWAHEDPDPATVLTMIISSPT